MSQKISQFNALEKERALQQESQSWDTSSIKPAQHGDIPVIDVGPYFLTESDIELTQVAEKLRAACSNVGFYTLVGHQLPITAVEGIFNQVRRFHKLPIDQKSILQMDQDDWPIKGVGYLPQKNRKLPQRATGNQNEAFLIKHNHQIALSENRWPEEQILAGFRSGVEKYASQMTELANRLLPIYARALDMPANYFAPAFKAPFYRLRLTHYPSQPSQANDQFGIAPHVDTTFFTILAQDSPGLSVYSEVRKEWVSVPMLEEAFVVNTGELLKHWSNDVFISTKHFANNNISNHSRYSIPFFYNANTEYKMHCIPSCCGPDRPAKYPPISYSESQGVVQGE